MLRASKQGDGYAGGWALMGDAMAPVYPPTLVSVGVDELSIIPGTRGGRIVETVAAQGWLSNNAFFFPQRSRSTTAATAGPEVSSLGIHV